jgi:hypothetical protein
MKAEEKLLAVAEEPAVVVGASCDQLAAALTHAQSWFSRQRCPETKFGLYAAELISANRGICAIMRTIARDAPQGQWTRRPEVADKIGDDFLDRIEQARNAGIYLRLFSGQIIGA